MLADRVSARRIIIFGLMLYPLIGASLRRAGLFGIVALTLVAQILNGVTYAADAVGRGTLIRRSVSAGSIGKALGYFDSVSMMGWIVAALIGAAAVAIMPLPWMFSAIIPTSLIALWITYTIKPDVPPTQPPLPGRLWHKIISSYRQFLSAMRHWKRPMRHCAVSTAATEMLNITSDFIIPIYSFGTGASLSQVMIIGVFANMPTLFGSRFGWLVDKNPRLIRSFVFLSSAMLIGSLALIPNYYWQIAVAFILGIAVELAGLANAAIATRLTASERRGNHG